MNASSTLAITTCGPVAAAYITRTEAETAHATQRQALDGALQCVMAVLTEAHARLDSVQSMAVCSGPGSFTGLRIGVALAKSIAQARTLPIVGVSSYDVAEYDVPAERFPRAELVEGKRNFYYVRVRDAANAAPRFAAGSREELADFTNSAEVRFLADVPATEQALRVARIGRGSLAARATAGWSGVDIDYGQRPNAVINWEARRGS